MKKERRSAIDVTPEMIAAGEAVLDRDPAISVARDVYIAMETVRLRAQAVKDREGYDDWHEEI